MPTYLSPGVYVEEVDSGSRPIEGVGTAVAAFVGLAGKGPFNTPTLVSNWSQFIVTFGDFVTDAYLAHAVYGYFQNGGGNCYIVRIGDDGGGNGNQPKEIESAPQAMLGDRLRVVALDEGTRPGDIEVEVTAADGDSPSDDMFRLVIKRGGQVVEEFDRATVGRGRQNVATMVNAGSKVIRIEDAGAGAGLEKPSEGSISLVAPPSAPSPSPSFATDDYVGDVTERTGFGGLEAVDEVTMLSVPDLMSAYQQGLVDLETVQAVQLGMIAHCELMGNRVAILDPPPGLNAQQIKEWRVDKARYDSKYATLYWPWVKVFDPATAKMQYIPPSGHMAGIWGRNDDTRGVHKAPANEVIRGAVDLEAQITRNEHGLLNPVGINCLRAFPGGGIRVYGARTLSSDPAWRYLNVRRLFNYLEESILNGTQWVVFEPNDDALWAKIRRTISAFLVNEWRTGALFGLTPDEAFYVKCDRETNPSGARPRGPGRRVLARSGGCRVDLEHPDRRRFVAAGQLEPVEMHALHARAGRPSTRELAKGQAFSYTAVHDLFTKTTVEAPKFTVLHKVVERMSAMAPRANVDEVLDRFDALWIAADVNPFETMPPREKRNEPFAAAEIRLKVQPIPRDSAELPLYKRMEVFFSGHDPEQLHQAAEELRRGGYPVLHEQLIAVADGSWLLKFYSKLQGLTTREHHALNEIAKANNVKLDGWGKYVTVGPPSFIAEIPADRSPGLQLVLSVPDADAAEASLDELGVDGPFEETHFGTKMTTVRNPDGRVWGLQAPLSGEPRARM